MRPRFVPVPRNAEWERAVAQERALGRIAEGGATPQRVAAGGSATLRPVAAGSPVWIEVARLEIPSLPRTLTIQTSRTDARAFPRTSMVTLRGKLSWGFESFQEECEFDWHEGRTMHLVAGSAIVSAQLTAAASADVATTASAMICEGNLAQSSLAPTYTVANVASGDTIDIPRRASGVRVFTGAADFTGSIYGNTRLNFLTAGITSRVPVTGIDLIPIPWPSRQLTITGIGAFVMPSSVQLQFELQL